MWLSGSSSRVAASSHSHGSSQCNIGTHIVLLAVGCVAGVTAVMAACIAAPKQEIVEPHSPAFGCAWPPSFYSCSTLQVITCADFHPQHCNIFGYSTSKGCIRLADMRAAALCDQHCKIFEDSEPTVRCSCKAGGVVAAGWGAATLQLWLGGAPRCT